MSIIHPGSRCVHCFRKIRWYENVPVIGYILLGGKCAGCGASISWRYPFVEMLTAALVEGIVWRHLWGPEAGLDAFDGTVLALARIYLTAALIVCSFIDFDFRILPNTITYSGIAVGLLFSGAFPVLHAHEVWAFEVFGRAGIGKHLAGEAAALAGATTGAAWILLVRTVGTWVFRKEAMGEGDIYYMGFIGAFLGWQGVLFTFVLACLAGSIYGIIYFVITRNRYLPFGPFLSLGAYGMMLFREPVESLFQGYMRWLHP